MAQNYSFNFSGSGNGGSGSTTGSGTGTVTPGGTAAISFTLQDSGNSNCDNRGIFQMKVQFSSGDTLSMLFLVPDANTGNQTNISLSGTLTVTGGTGAFANIGGTGNATVTAVISQTNGTFTFTFAGTITLAGVLNPSALVNAGGMVPVFSNQGSVQPGSWVSLFGTSLANGTSTWNGDFPTSLGGVTVSVNGKLGYLWFVSATQINVQLPDDSKTGCVPVVVTTPNGPVNFQVDLEPISPSLSLLDNQYVAAVILTPNGTGAYGGGTYDLAGPTGKYSFKTRPVKRGETIELFGVGFGPTRQPVQAGKPFSGAVGIANVATIGLSTKQSNLGVQPAFAGIVGAGLYQFNLTIPQNAPTGDVNIGVFINTPNAAPGSQPIAFTSQDFPTLIPIQ